MDQNFRRRLQKTLYSGELEPDHSPLALTELAVEYFQDLAPHKLGHVDLQSASFSTSQDTVSPSSVTMSMIYAKRLQRKRPDYIRKMSSSDLFLISMMMASKYLYDEGVEEEVFNDEWAENAGLEKEEINNMELDFLNALEWELFIKKDDFEQAMLSIENRIALKEGLKRGWFSYSDLCLLLDDPATQLSISDVGLEWLKVVMVSSAAYFVGVMTMVGSTVLVSNASTALASSGLLLPALHIAPSVPSSLPFSTARSPVSMVEFPDPTLDGFNFNETGSIDEEEDREEPKAVPETPDLTWNPGKSVVETIMSQLMAVLTIKSHVAQFVSAVAASSSSYRNRCTKQPASFTAGSDKAADDQAESPDAVLSRWFGMEESSTVEPDSDAGFCTCCGKRMVPSKMDAGFVPFDVEFQTCEWWRDDTAQLNRLECDAGRGGRGLRRGWSNGDGRAGNLHPQKECCSREAMGSMCSLFPDITIGFSTSMPPPVYAT